MNDVFTDDSLLPEYQPPLMITAAPYGPMWLPSDCKPIHQLPVTWEEHRNYPAAKPHFGESGKTGIHPDCRRMYDLATGMVEFIG